MLLPFARHVNRPARRRPEPDAPRHRAVPAAPGRRRPGGARVADHRLPRAPEPAKVSKAARERVAAAIAETGYVPDLVASILTSRSTRPGRRVVSDHHLVDLRVHGGRAHGGAARAGVRGADRRLGAIRSTASRSSSQRSSAAAPMASCCRASTHSVATRRLLERARVPVVETGNLTRRSDRHGGRLLRTMAPPSRCSTTSSAAAIARSDSSARPTTDNPQAADRRRALGDAVDANGLRDRPPRCRGSARRPRCGCRGGPRIVAAHPEVTAISPPARFARSVRCSSASGAAARAGVASRWPASTMPDSAPLMPALTTVHVPRETIGRRAAQMILDRQAGRTVPERCVDVGYEVVGARKAHDRRAP